MNSAEAFLVCVKYNIEWLSKMISFSNGLAASSLKNFDKYKMGCATCCNHIYQGTGFDLTILHSALYCLPM